MMRPGAASPAWRAWRRHAPLTVVLATLPLMLLAALAVYVLWQRQQDELRIQHRATARAIAAAVERELAGTVRQLEYMATSPLLDAPKLDAFRNDAERALATSKHWSNLVVFDAGAQQVLNTRNPVPETRSTAGQDHVRAVLLEGRPLVSDVFVGPSSGKPVAAVTVPVMREGRARAALSVALDLPTLDALLQSSAGESAVVAAIWDRHHHFITRSIAPEKHRGQQPVPSLVQASRAAPEGWRRLKTLEGTEVFSAWTPVGSTGWSVAIAVSSAAADALLANYLWGLAVAETLILAMAVPVAVRLRREAGERERAEAERDRLFALEHQARAAAETASRAKDEFLAMLGHELRNPLAAVSTAVKLLETDKVTPETAAFARGVIARQTEHLARLLDDLLDVGRVVTGKIYLQRELVDLAGIAESAVNAARAAGKAAGHTLTFEGTSAHVNADRTRLEQIIANLVGNALNYTPAGGAIHVSVAREGDQAVLRVRDTGVGLEPSQRERVFDLFYQGDGELHRKGGLGIGLTLVHRLVELHDGSVAVASEGPGKGAEFTVRLPAVAAPRAEAAAIAPAGTGGARSILLIEDNQDARESLAALLALEGHEVHQAGDGRSGVEAVARIKPDIALVDIGLPHMNGYEVARTIRARDGRDVFLVALTGYGQPEDEQRAKEAGFDAHLVKPAELDRLRAVIARSR